MNEKRRQKTMAFIYIEMDYDTHNITGILCDIAWYNMHNIYIYIELLTSTPGFACLEKLQETTCSRPIDCDFSWCLLHQTIFIIYIYIYKQELDVFTRVIPQQFPTYLSHVWATVHVLTMQFRSSYLSRNVHWIMSTSNTLSKKEGEWKPVNMIVGTWYIQ